jgi:hypothetical protein
MESILLGIKAVEFAVMELLVVAVLGSALILGLQEIVRERLRESSLVGETAPEPRPVAP